MEKKCYATTDRAGFYVAGRKIPGVRDEDGNATPRVGYQLWLTEAEAEHDLRQGAIELVEPQPPAPNGV